MEEREMKIFSRIVPLEMYNRFQKEADEWHKLNELKKKWICDVCVNPLLKWILIIY